MKKFKKINRLGLLSVVITLTCVGIVALVGFTFGTDYRDSTNVDVQFTSSVDKNDFKDKVDDVKEFEKLEKKSDINYSLTYLELSESDKGKLESRLKEINGYSSIAITKMNHEGYGPDVLLFSLPFLGGTMIVGNYLLLTNLKKKKDRVGLSFSSLFTVAFATFVSISVLGALSYFISLNREIVNYFIFWFGLNLVLVGFVLAKYNLYLYENAEQSAQKNLVEFLSELRAKEKFFSLVVLGLVVVFVVPIIIISNEQVYISVASAILFLMQIYTIVLVLPQFFSIWNFAINNLPFIKKLKWARK